MELLINVARGATLTYGQLGVVGVVVVVVVTTLHISANNEPIWDILFAYDVVFDRDEYVHYLKICLINIDYDIDLFPCFSEDNASRGVCGGLLTR